MKIIKDTGDNKVHTCNKINNTTHVVIHDNIKNIHKKLTDCVIKRSTSLNKVHIENTTISNSKKTQVKMFNDVAKQMVPANRVHTQNNNVFNDDKCKKLHKELFNIVLKELISIDKVHIQNDAGNKDPSPNIKDNSINEVFTHNNQYEIDIMHNSLLHNHLSYYFNEIRKIRKDLS